MRIRKTRQADIDAVVEAINNGRRIQREENHLVQWSDDYPNRMVIEEDVAKVQSYVCVVDESDESELPIDTVLATFCLMKEPEPTYSEIDGAWINDRNDYVTIHRIATNGLMRGAGQFCMQWVVEHYPNVRIDTHVDNQIMTHLIQKVGFTYCGEIKLKDGSPRIAFQYLN